MQSLRQLVILFWLLPIGTFMWDLIDGLFFQDQLKFRSVHEWAQIVGPNTATSIRSVLRDFLSPDVASDVMTWYASPVLIILPLVLYVIYRALLAIKGGDRSRR